MEIAELAKELFQDTEVRIFGTIKDPLFVAADIGKMLGLAKINDTIRTYDDTRKVTGKVRTPGGEQLMTLLTEKGLYAILFTSHKKAAIKFQDWAINVIREIRLHGRYDANELEISFAEKSEQVVALTQKVEELSSNYKPQIVYHEIDPNDFTDEPCVYLFHLHENDFKFGVTGEIDTRTYAHSNNFIKHGVSIKLIKLWKCESMKIMRDTEAKIKLFAKHNGILVSKYEQKEILTTDNIAGMVDAITKYVNEQNSKDERILKIRELELHNRGIELQNRGIELQIELLKTRSALQPESARPLLTAPEVSVVDAFDNFIAQTTYTESKQNTDTVYLDYAAYCAALNINTVTKPILIRKLKMKGFIVDTKREQKSVDGKRISTQYCEIAAIHIKCEL